MLMNGICRPGSALSAAASAAGCAAPRRFASRRMAAAPEVPGSLLRDRVGARHRAPTVPPGGMARTPSDAALVVSIAAVTTALTDLPLLASGKVREMYVVEDDLLMVASDRISAYDVVLPTPIPDKGRVLTQMSVFWFETTGHICPTTISPRTRPPRLQGGRCGCGGWTCCPVSAWPGATCRARAGAVPPDGCRLRDRAARGPA